MLGCRLIIKYEVATLYSQKNIIKLREAAKKVIFLEARSLSGRRGKGLSGRATKKNCGFPN